MLFLWKTRRRPDSLLPDPEESWDDMLDTREGEGGPLIDDCDGAFRIGKLTLNDRPMYSLVEEVRGNAGDYRVAAKKYR